MKKFTKEEVGDNKIPHVGFNSVEFSSDQGLCNGLGENADFYFTHSFRMNADNLHANLGMCAYGKQFLAAFEHENVCGTQFDPEKSQTNGLVLLKNFLQN